MDFYDTKGRKIKYSKEYSWRPAVYGVLIENKRLLFIQPSWDDKFCLPGGGMDLGETPMKALEREFLEETGYKVRVESQPVYVDSRLFGGYDANKFFQRISIYYEVTRISKKQNTKIDEESIEIIWKNLKKIKSNDFSFFQRDFIKTLLRKY
jgi:8-oxo-dGTP pyrophosphatase MutT (NUDIX family)